MMWLTVSVCLWVGTTFACERCDMICMKTLGILARECMSGEKLEKG